MRQINNECATIITSSSNHGGDELKLCRRRHQSNSSTCDDDESLESVATCEFRTGLGGGRDIPRAISLPTTPIKAVPCNNNNNNSTPPRQFTNAAVATANLSPYKRKIEAIGNGWNAKGLQNAKAGQWGKAVQCWENALDIRLQILGEYHPDVANTWNNLGIALGKMRDYHRAMMCLNQTLEIRTYIHNYYNVGGGGGGGSNQELEIAATLENIGNIFQQMKDYNGALACFEQAKTTQIVWKEHVLVARTCTAIGRLHSEHSSLDKALASYLEALLFYTKAGYGKGDDGYNSVQQSIYETERQMSIAL
jgi:tetratricopeptide (TPR) repeat protein